MAKESPCRARDAEGKVCGETIIWCVTTTGKRMPVNTWTTPTGNVVMHDETKEVPLVRVLKKGEDVPEGTRRHLAHFATCKARAKGSTTKVKPD